MRQSQKGFTVIELVVAVVFLIIAGVLVAMQQSSLAATHRDTQRKTAINAMYYSLENVFYKQNGYYPTTINETVLPSVDPELFLDPIDIKIGESSSDYRYETAHCINDRCQKFTLHAALEKEAEYIKTNSKK